MKEIWKEVPGGDGHYMLSNFGNLARTKDVKDGVATALIARASTNTYNITVRGERRVLDIKNAVAKLHGIPCGGEGTECRKLECRKCGHNPEVAKKRIDRIHTEGLTEIDGKRCLILHNGL